MISSTCHKRPGQRSFILSHVVSCLHAGYLDRDGTRMAEVGGNTCISIRGSQLCQAYPSSCLVSAGTRSATVSITSYRQLTPWEASVPHQNIPFLAQEPRNMEKQCSARLKKSWTLLGTQGRGRVEWGNPGLFSPPTPFPWQYIPSQTINQKG